MPAQATELRETVYLDSAPQVDAEAGVLRRVKFIGLESLNGRRYRPAALQAAAGLYEGRKIYIDHPGAESSDRSIKDWAGTIKSARFESDGIYGDVKLRKESPHFRGIIEAATEFPKDVGFSHVADGDSQYEGDTEIVESIRKVFSVDLVADPATTHGFFESARKPKPRTIRQAIESLPESTVRTRLIEMAGSAYDIDVSLDGDKPADPLAAAHQIIQELIAQLGKTMAALATAKATPPTPAPSAQPAPEDDMENEDKTKELKVAMESLQAERDALLAECASLKAKVLLLESGREVTDVMVEALTKLDSDEKRKALLESVSIPEPEERPFRSPAKFSESDVADFPRDDSAKFAASLR